MHTDYIYNDRGIIIGRAEDIGSSINYYHMKLGFVGRYDKVSRQYFRYRTRLGSAMPLSREDYGKSDVLSAEHIN